MQVIFVEEPAFRDQATPLMSMRDSEDGAVTIATPVLPSEGRAPETIERSLVALVDGLIETIAPEDRIFWFYTPMMVDLVEGKDAAAVVYDCMDELSKFLGAPDDLIDREIRLLDRADLVFTGGRNLYEAKRDRHPSVHAFPSSVDRGHFAAARDLAEPADQRDIPHPRLGYYGVVDERIDLDTLAALADANGEWSIVVVGPVVKIDPAKLPRRDNLHYLGQKAYRDLPAYLAGWDVALMPFAMNEATRFISPTKTLEYLAGGKPVVSTPIKDVVGDHGHLAAISIAEPGLPFVDACGDALQPLGKVNLPEIDAHLAIHSWDRTQKQMQALIDQVMRRRGHLRAAPPGRSAYGPTTDILIVGAGPAGCVMAERFANDGGKRVTIVDRRSHIAGNTHDHLDAAGILIHRYGPHIFHTNSTDIFRYLSQFTAWRPYEHRVLGRIGEQLLPIPINRDTLNRLNGLSLSSEEEAEAYLQSLAEPKDEIRTSEDVVVSRVGRRLYELFFQGYSRKQWGLDPSQLDRSVTARVPIRTNRDDRYFTDKHQAMPRDGYTAMFEAMLDHPNITVLTGLDYRDIKDRLRYEHLIFTGPIDEFFDHRFGRLPYRSLVFKHETLDQPRFQPVATVNYPSPDIPFTRVTEYKHLTGQVHSKTSITYEFGSDDGEPYYPVPRPQNQALYKRYEELGRTFDDVTFVGRLGTYRYYNIDQVVGQALATYARLIERLGRTATADAKLATPLLTP